MTESERSPVTPAAVLYEARAWLYTPFQHQAAVKGVGCDCIGLVRGVGHALRAFTFDPTDPEHLAWLTYKRDPQFGLMRAACEKWLVEIPIEAAIGGDVVMMALAVAPQHTAILTEGGTGIIHALSTARGVVEHGIDDAWRRRIVAAFRFPAVAAYLEG